MYIKDCTVQSLIQFYYERCVLPWPQKFNLLNVPNKNSFILIGDNNEKIFCIHSNHFVMGKQSINSSNRHQIYVVIEIEVEVELTICYILLIQIKEFTRRISEIIYILFNVFITIYLNRLSQLHQWHPLRCHRRYPRYLHHHP